MQHLPDFSTRMQSDDESPRWRPLCRPKKGKRFGISPCEAEALREHMFSGAVCDRCLSRIMRAPQLGNFIARHLRLIEDADHVDA